MKALSFRQPYAWLSATGIKPVDNRPRPTNYRGRFYIHASKSTKALKGFDEAWVLERLTLQEKERYYTEPKPIGVIIGEAVLVDCVESHTSIWFVPGNYALVFAEPKLYNIPVPCKGAIFPLFFEPDIDFLREVKNAA